MAPIAVPTPIPAFAPVLSPLLADSCVFVGELELGLDDAVLEDTQDDMDVEFSWDEFKGPSAAYVGVPEAGKETIVNRSSGAGAGNRSEVPISQLRSPRGGKSQQCH